jgi:CRISPR system Cascade subunit CasD
MSTLLLFLTGPMQSWGVQSRFTQRDTGLEPSKSGVIGLLCAALGRPRSVPVDDLATLRMGVRVDQEGVLRRDYHTAGGVHRLGDTYGVISADGKGRRAAVSNRYYMADAQFLVGLESSNDPLLEQLQAALQYPVWQLSLGRKAFLPSVPPYLEQGVFKGVPLQQALAGYRWPVAGELCPLRPAQGTTQPGQGLRLVLELGSGETPGPTDIVEERLDQPFGTAFWERRFYPRRTVTTFIIPLPLHQEA